MGEKTFHRRDLMPPSVQFSSTEGQKIFKTALQEGGLENYFQLAEVYQTQGAPAFCGLGSLSMCLNALMIDPGRVWQGVWRWFADDMLDCCENIEEVKERGIIMEKLACLARCNEARCDEYYADESFTEDIFRSLVVKATSSSGAQESYVYEDDKISIPSREIMIVSYNRQVLNQTGSGHFSPVGGYCAEKDLVLILDVARFKLPPHWVPLSLLFKAMRDLDPSSGKPRGALMLSRSLEMVRSCDELCRRCCETKDVD